MQFFIFRINLFFNPLWRYLKFFINFHEFGIYTRIYCIRFSHVLHLCTNRVIYMKKSGQVILIPNHFSPRGEFSRFKYLKKIRSEHRRERRNHRKPLLLLLSISLSRISTTTANSPTCLLSRGFHPFRILFLSPFQSYVPLPFLPNPRLEIPFIFILLQERVSSIQLFPNEI